MLPFSRFHAATLLDVSAWSTLSRNEVRSFLDCFGIQPLRRKIPMMRVYEQLLGVSPSGPLEDEMLGGGLVRTTIVAERFGVSGDVLLDELRAPGNSYPPLYAVGPKRHLMLKAQVEQVLASPRNAFHHLTAVPGHALPASDLARCLEVRQSRIDAILADKDDLPARIINRGRISFIVSDVARRLTAMGPGDGPSAPAQTPTVQDSDVQRKATPPRTNGAHVGLFSDIAARATARK